MLYEDGATSGRVMSICLHPFIIGHPHRSKYLAKALAHITGEARLKTFNAAPNPFAALARLFGASADSARLMAAASELAHDPQAQALLQGLHDARLREQGATVLAPTLPPAGR